MSEELKPCPTCGGIYELPKKVLNRHQLQDRLDELAALREENERLRQLMQLLYEQVRYMPSRNITTIG